MGNLKYIQKQDNDLPNTYYPAAQLSTYGQSCLIYYPPNWIILKEIPDIICHFICKYVAMYL